MEQKIPLLPDGNKKRRNRVKSLTQSEIMTILVYFHASGYRNFKTFYNEHVLIHLKNAFPGLLTYTRFVAITQSVLVLLCMYLKSRFDKPTGIAYIDSTKIEVCHKKRMSSNRVFSEIGKIGKTTMGWFFGFKLHLIINEKGGLLQAVITPGNVDDRTPVPFMVQNLFGKLFADKGYISKSLTDFLSKKHIQFITYIKKKMKNKLMEKIDKILLNKRVLIETVNDQLKNMAQIEHTRHRSIWNFMVNVICGLLAYTFQDKKPRITDVEYLDDDQGFDRLLIA